MATQTLNYNLTKPGAEDPVDISVLNANFDTIDGKIKEATDAIPPVATAMVPGIVKPDNYTIVVDLDGTIHGAQTYMLPAASSDTLGGVMIGDNLTVDGSGRISAPSPVDIDLEPTANSTGVPQSGGTYDMINVVIVQADEISSRVDDLTALVAAFPTNLIWKASVPTFSDIATTYLSPDAGWTVMCRDTCDGYLWDGSAWNWILTSLLPVASTDEVSDILSTI